MKQTLTTQLVQNWNILDLKPMHRASLRRMVNATEDNMGSPIETRAEIRWHQESLVNSDEQELLAMLRRPGVLIIDRDALCRRIAENRAFDTVLEALHLRFCDQIRLLWHWSLRGKQDLLWCTEMAMDGVISDPQSLVLWSRVCMRKGKVIEGQTNTLLSGIRLPTLAAPNPTIT